MGDTGCEKNYVYVFIRDYNRIKVFETSLAQYNMVGSSLYYSFHTES